MTTKHMKELPATIVVPYYRGFEAEDLGDIEIRFNSLGEIVNESHREARFDLVAVDDGVAVYRRMEEEPCGKHQKTTGRRIRGKK